MAKRSGFLTLSGIGLERGAPTALHRQLYQGLADAILSRRLVQGTRLPPTRELASELFVSRNTVVTAYEQLLAEGYIESKVGSGTYVSPGLPDEILRLFASSQSPTRTRAAAAAALSRRGAGIASTPSDQWQDSGKPRAFRPGIPALDEFPLETWRHLANKRWRTLPREELAYGKPEGYLPLRQAIAAYLGPARRAL